ncbi:multidrug efflux pump subunit AcrB [Bradyrhizobium sp. F1.13.1]
MPEQQSRQVVLRQLLPPIWEGQPDHLILGQSEAAQDISFQAMAERQQAMPDAVMRDPAVASIGSAVGAGGGTSTVNDGRVFIQLKSADERDPIDKVIGRLRTNLAKIQGITLYMQPAQDIRSARD